jgi:hypothetical protein
MQDENIINPTGRDLNTKISGEQSKCIFSENVRNKYFSSQCSFFSSTEEKSNITNFSCHSNRRKNEKSAPVGITCQYFSAPRVGEVKVWYKIPPRAHSLDIKSPTNAPVGIYSTHGYKSLSVPFLSNEILLGLYR